jgi:hypothetical protein
MRMEVLIAIELIVGTVFVVWFWYTNPEPVLSRRLGQQLLDLYDDEEDDDASMRQSSICN